MTFTVRDEPPILEGYTLQAQKLKRRTNRCRSLVRLRGKVAFSDNEDKRG